MDTITYRLDPTNLVDMISALTEWPRFNIAVVRKSSAAIYSSWDQYDKSNDECLRTFILESLVGDLKERKVFDETQVGGHCNGFVFLVGQ